MSIGFKRCFRGIGKQRQIRWVAEGGMESPVVTEWGLSVMKILAVLQYKISYHINYIATGSGAFCDTNFVYQKRCTDFRGGGYKISLLCCLQGSTRMPAKMKPETPWCSSRCARGQKANDLWGARNNQLLEMSWFSQKLTPSPVLLLKYVCFRMAFFYDTIYIFV